MAYSVQTGKVSSALIMGKLGSYARQNKLATALGEMGRIEKTLFTLDYISNKAVRRRVQKGLNKGEAINALARIIFLDNVENLENVLSKTSYKELVH